MKYFFRRGFVWKVEATLFEWYGGRCVGGGWVPPCHDCHGTGRTPGHGPALVRACPLERVTLSDRPVIHLPDDVARHLPTHPESAADAVSMALLAWAREAA